MANRRFKNLPMGKASPKNQANRGRAWETRLDRVHTIYQKAGLAYVARLHPPYLMRRSMGKGRFEGLLLGQGPPDYLICSAGYTFLMDAKEHKGARFPFGKIPEHQASAFDSINKYGGDKMTGLILVNYEKVGLAFAIDWRDIREAYYNWSKNRKRGIKSPAGVASLSLEAAKEVSLWSGDSRLGGCDYLPAVLLALRLQELEEEKEE